MKKSDELLNPASCLNQAADDEPLFVLRANDELAPLVVRWWADRYWARKGGIGKITERQRAKCAEAGALAHEMEKWRDDRHALEVHQGPSES